MVAAKATDDQIIKTLQKHNGVRSAAASELGLNERTLLHRLKRMKQNGHLIPESTYQPGKQTPSSREFEFTPLPDDDVPIEELI